MTQIKAVVLDIGEVLLRLDFKRIFATLELGQDVEVSAAIDKLNHWDLYDTFERGKITPEKFHQRVCGTLKKPVSYDDFVAAWNSVIVHEIEGIPQLLGRVAVPLYALSNSNELHIAHCLSRYPWFSLFREVFSSHLLALRKPEPEIYRRVATLTGESPTELLFVDDRRENVEGAETAGYRAEICDGVPKSLDKILSKYNVLST